MYCPFQLIPTRFPATMNMVAPSSAMAFQIWNRYVTQFSTSACQASGRLLYRHVNVGLGVG